MLSHVTGRVGHCDLHMMSPSVTGSRRRRAWIAFYPTPFIFLFLTTFIYPSLQLSSRRSLSELSAANVAALVASRDPIPSVDVTDPNSHLSRILIPRARNYPHGPVGIEYLYIY